MSRPSAYPNNQAPTNHLATCIASVDFACRTLEASNAVLSQESQDFSRMSNVLRSKRHFDLISQQEIRQAHEHLSAEILPQLKELIVRAEEALQKDDRKAKLLKHKAAQQSTRLEQLAQLHDIPLGQLRTAILEETQPVATPSAGQADSAAEAKRMQVKLQALQSKRQEMQRDLARLEEEVGSR